MSKVKPWQLGVIALGLLVGVGSMVWTLSSRSDVELNPNLYLVDVETGQVYVADVSRYGMALPARHPSSKRTSLVRVTKQPDGSFEVSERDLQTLGALDEGVKVTAIDTETGKLKSPPSKPMAYKRPD